MSEVKPETVMNTENVVRDVRNWLAVFKTEYDIADEAYDKLHHKIEEIGTKVAGIKCDAEGVEEESVKPVSDTLAETKQWLAVFAEEYDLAEEAVKVLTEQFDKIGEKLAAIECK